MAALTETTIAAAADATWVDITTLYTLTATAEYWIQNIGSSDLEISENASAPAASTNGHILQPRESKIITQDAALEWYVTGRGGATTYAISQETAAPA